MNVQLEPMTNEDFEQYLAFSIPNYANEHVKSGNWTEEESLERSAKEYQQLLPDGKDTKTQYMYRIVETSSGNKIGYLWFNIKEKTKHKAFIFDFLIFDSYRGKGYGKQAMQALDNEAKKHGAEQIALHVFGHNHTAIGLYKKMGYEVTNLHMTKYL